MTRLSDHERAQTIMGADALAQIAAIVAAAVAPLHAKIDEIRAHVVPQTSTAVETDKPLGD